LIWKQINFCANIKLFKSINTQHLISFFTKTTLVAKSLQPCMSTDSGMTTTLKLYKH